MTNFISGGTIRALPKKKEDIDIVTFLSHVCIAHRYFHVTNSICNSNYTRALSTGLFLFRVLNDEA